jgi:hypothetical protein
MEQGAVSSTVQGGGKRRMAVMEQCHQLRQGNTFSEPRLPCFATLKLYYFAKSALVVSRDSSGSLAISEPDLVIKALEIIAARQAWSGFHIYSDPRSRHEHALVPLIGKNATTGAPHSEFQGNALVLLKIIRTFWVAQRYAYIIRKRPGRYSNQDLSSAHT